MICCLAFRLPSRDLTGARDMDDVIENASGDIAWGSDEVLFFLTKVNCERENVPSVRIKQCASALSLSVHVVRISPARTATLPSEAKGWPLSVPCSSSRPQPERFYIRNYQQGRQSSLRESSYADAVSLLHFALTGRIGSALQAVAIRARVRKEARACL